MSSSLVLIIILGVVGVGLYALLIARNLIKVVVALQVMVKGAILAMIAAGQAAGEPLIGESMALTVIVADTIVAVVGLALAVQVRRRFGTLDIKEIAILRR